MKILIIEDEQEMRENMQNSLEREDFVVETADGYHDALSKIGVYEYDCILLDISLPDGNGLEILKELKNKEISDNVIIVSAKDSLDDKIKGLDLGADDYLPKPFHIAELHARINAVLRRKKFDGYNILNIANVSINFDKHLVFIDNNEISFNRKEFDILLYLVTNKDRLVNKSALAEHVWGDYIDQSDDFEFIYSQIKNLRKKLNTYKADIEIKAVYGIGYKLISL
ncbi:DNA-binding response regulator, OmpR family, contains REC and winged-helix (wHTH) domain [Gillisia sp. Hel1_33_143]|uniref:response regulator transcription factor n=1 Tax=unclassified Gillisia TaxID=2615025 RepID=UPI000553F22D|nr:MULTISPECIES: response regulator transcription factor [unclassified Gillisia]SDR77636.1 DNA-binding response regulator, OmpR family, contains REC and winged-helix (wHTH) domain [Gillisia sp. Hel1_33_143]